MMISMLNMNAYDNTSYAAISGDLTRLNSYPQDIKLDGNQDVATYFLLPPCEECPYARIGYVLGQPVDIEESSSSERGSGNSLDSEERAWRDDYEDHDDWRNHTAKGRRRKNKRQKRRLKRKKNTN